MTGSLLVAGTTSDAGKSVVTTGLCRAFARRGLRVAPFKAQNMSNNSMVTGDGAEIGRAQWVQAVAARAEPESAMNPVLLKPGSDLRSHVVVRGRPAGRLEAGAFAGGRAALAEAAFAAYDELAARFDVVVCEGAGSPAEVNLRAHDYVNMGLARHGGIPTVLVGDIDRGGVFAAMHGTLALLDAADQALLAGFVVNKFRGDVGLLRPGLDTLERVTGRPVLGVLPWLPGLWLDSEDALALRDRAAAPSPVVDRTRVAVVVLPRISNFTDLDALCLEPGLDVVFADSPRALSGADVVVLPGTRATVADLAWLRERGLADAVVAHARRGGAVLGVCGGFQMLGRTVADPHGVEGEPGAVVEGLGLLEVRTEFTLGEGAAAAGRDRPRRGGRRLRDPPRPGRRGRAASRSRAACGAGTSSGRCGTAASRATRSAGPGCGRWVRSPDETVSFPRAREARLDLVADALEEHVDLDALLALVTSGVPSYPVVRGGLVPG